LFSNARIVDFTILRPYEGSAKGRKMLELAAPLRLVLSKFPIICGTELWEAAMIDLAGGLGMVITVLFVVILGAGLAYGIWASRHAPRDPVTLKRKDEATRENFSEKAVEERPLLGDKKSQ
jgi:hypothetical protein